jgi:hypothetical protein
VPRRRYTRSLYRAPASLTPARLQRPLATRPPQHCVCPSCCISLTHQFQLLKPPSPSSRRRPLPCPALLWSPCCLASGPAGRLPVCWKSTKPHTRPVLYRCFPTVTVANPFRFHRRHSIHVRRLHSLSGRARHRARNALDRGQHPQGR